MALLIGIDVGTSGVRVVAADAEGTVLAEAERPLTSDRQTAEGAHEQDPADWWSAVCQASQVVAGLLREKGCPASVAGVAVTSTSGSLVVTDASGCPLRWAILYDDIRSAEVAVELNRRAEPLPASLNASYSLVKAAWVRETEPAVWDRARYLLHPADWLAGKLTGRFGVSDYSNTLKLGYDPERGQWSDLVCLAVLPPERLPEVVKPGQQIGIVSAQAAQEAGLPAKVPVVAVATDGMACLLASGASEPKHANTTLGTTLVWKALSKNKPALGPGMYCHLHPGGTWAPGAASNTGPGSLKPDDPPLTPTEMDRMAAANFPTPVVCYLLKGRGERFPFVNRHATTFVEGQPGGPSEWYAAQLQSIGFAERWGYEVLQECGVEIGDVVYSSGAAARSPILSQLRADILNRMIIRSRHPTAAFGAAILAATGTHYSGAVGAAIRAMTKVCETYTPSSRLTQRYDEIYGRFREACARRGYV